MQVVGITGKKQSGKDTIASVLVEEYGYVRVGFADALKELAYNINPIVQSTISSLDPEVPSPFEEEWRLSEVVDDDGWEHAKEFHPEVRRFLQELGTQIRALNPDFWIDQVWSRIYQVISADGKVVVPDVRFLNEAEEIRRFGGVIWRVERPGLDNDDTHISETELENIAFDAYSLNLGVDALKAQVREAAQYLDRTETTYQKYMEQAVNRVKRIS